MSLLFARERLDRIWDEIQPLFREHYHEIAWRQDQIPLVPDYNRYHTLDEEGMLLCFTGRDGRKLVAYAFFFVSTHIHYQQTKVAVNDILFVHPRYRNRGSGTELINFCEAELKALEVQVMTLHVKPKLDWGHLAEDLGYELGDRIWQKWLGS